LLRLPQRSIEHQRRVPGRERSMNSSVQPARADACEFGARDELDALSRDVGKRPGDRIGPG
jgi:hypothetical protein